MPTKATLAALVALTIGSTAYSLATARAARRFRRRPRAQPATDSPTVSILKPIHGRDPHLYDCLRSHVEQDYPRFDLLAGAADPHDPAFREVRRLAAEFPHCAIRAFITGASGGGNPKAAVLETLAAAATGELLLISDADIVVGRDLLQRLTAELERPGVRLVTCLYRARPGATLAATLDALWIGAEFGGQALVAESLPGGLEFAFGSAMLLRRRDLEALGGFAAIRPYLADDYQLGARISAAGGRVELSREVVETCMADVRFADVWRRHLRWSRNVRACRPAGHGGLLWTFTGVWSLALLIAARARAPWSLLAAGALGTRLAAAASVAAALDDRNASARLAWLPLADLASFGVWAASFLSRTVSWGGRRLDLDSQGRIAAVRESRGEDCYTRNSGR